MLVINIYNIVKFHKMGMINIRFMISCIIKRIKFQKQILIKFLIILREKWIIQKTNLGYLIKKSIKHVKI